MLPNHPPLIVAEQFGTLESLYPGRIDLALGRAVGSDQGTAKALRRSPEAGEAFPQDVIELMEYFRAPIAGQDVVAIPGAGVRVPLWILGSSLFGAQLAARLGLPFAFASHFAPALLHQAIATYRDQFRGSEHLEQPHIMLGVNVIAADTDGEARRLFTSLQQSFINHRRGRPGPVPPPVDERTLDITPVERAAFEPILPYTFVGSPDAVHARMHRFVAETGANELIVSSNIFDHASRLRSYEITADIASA
jgi:luciferase family oxidoreductase group 1